MDLALSRRSSGRKYVRTDECRCLQKAGIVAFMRRAETSAEIKLDILAEFYLS